MMNVDACFARPDPADYLGVLVYLMREKNYDAAMVEALVSRQSGLLGLSDTDSDMQRLHQNALTNAVYATPSKCSAIPCASNLRHDRRA